MMTIELPKEPMAPIAVDALPVGNDWGYQIKWDGVRLLARVENERVELFSRRLLNKTSLYPEAVALLQPWLKQNCLLDGEAVIFDQSRQRPNFQLILQRERSRSGPNAGPSVRTGNHFIYVLFDLLHLNGEDLRQLPFAQRHRMLRELVPEKQPQLFVADLFDNAKALWNWVTEAGWEGVVCKRLTSPYSSGKNHRDWYKKKTALEFEVDIAGLIIRGGQVASLVMVKDGVLFGRVASGLNEQRRKLLLEEGLKRQSEAPIFTDLPMDLKKEQILWLQRPFGCTVTGLDMTDDGHLRHPKIVRLHDMP
ncbi:DNA ligase [Paenibacillus xerothermodurans]|uniref:DNA ligase n=1 Tax=Paenibacillus xerothermodurans TaxID=1977292 RepID=A0A2W1N7Q4_PAEXE|nr:DNA ligase [Paenibacillus xerothermodurans]